MRNSCPFVRNKLAGVHGRAVIVGVQLGIGRAQPVLGKAFAVFRLCMRKVFKLRKHCLTEQRGAELLKMQLQKIFLHFNIIGVVKQIVQQQHLVYRGGNLRHKGAVSGLGIGKSSVGMV